MSSPEWAESSAGPEVCYVIPDLDPGGSSHFAHLPAFLTEVARHCRLVVIATRGLTGARVPGVEVIVLRHGAGNRIRWMAELVGLARRLRRRGCRRFFVRISTTAALALAAARPWLGIALYYWTSGQATNLLPPWRARPFARLKGEIGLLPLRAVLRVADRIVTGPERMLTYYQREFGVHRDRCLLLYNDIDLGRFTPAPRDRGSIRQRFDLPQHSLLALFVHRISHRKGCFEVVPILEALPADLTCLMVGDGPHLERLRAQIQERGLTRRIRLAGAVRNEELPPIYRAADVAIVPSHEEGFPRVVLEAMACGLSVVAYDVGGVRDLLGERQQEFVVNRGDVPGFAQALARLRSDPTLRDVLGRENLETVQRYSTPRVARMFAQQIVTS